MQHSVLAGNSVWLLPILCLFFLGCNEDAVQVDQQVECKIPNGAIGIVIGGSIAEGHPHSHGFYHGQCANTPGQISYHLQEESEMPVINLGVGGQTCTQIYQRWQNDVLDNHPAFVWLNCGHNDMEQGRTVEMIESLNEIFEKTRESQIPLFVQTIGINSAHPSRQAAIDKMNEFILDNEGEYIKAIPFHEWEKHIDRARFFADHIHLRPRGYMDFMNFAGTGGHLQLLVQLKQYAAQYAEVL